MTKPLNRALGFLILITALTRFAFRSHYLYDIDSVNFALAMDRFDPQVHQPHPPGYFLYILLGRFANLLFHDANAALVAISIVASCGAVWLICLLADQWFGWQAAVFAGLIFVFSPLAWFHGTVALTYVVETFFSALTGYLCWSVASRPNALRVFGAAVTVGIAAGFRPSSLLFLGPLLLFSLHSAGVAQTASGLGVLFLTLLAWCVPMLTMTGIPAYFSALTSLWLTVPSRETLLNSSILTSLARALLIVGIYFLCLGCIALLPMRRRTHDPPIDREKARFTAIWVTPGLLFFTFIFLKFVNSGYLLVLLPPLCLWTGWFASLWYNRARGSTPLKLLAVAGCAVVNAAIFIRAPWYCSYEGVRTTEQELESVVRQIPRIASPRDSIIVGFDSHFQGYRHAGYYLPDYWTIQYPGMPTATGKKIFTMRHRDTQSDDAIPAALPRNFILFPLPAGDPEYAQYLASVKLRFPPGALHAVVREGREFNVGAAADLHFLFAPASGNSGL